MISKLRLTPRTDLGVLARPSLFEVSVVAVLTWAMFSCILSLMKIVTAETMNTDEMLAEQIAQREQPDADWQEATAAFEQLYRRHARKLLAFLTARVRRSELEDVHQSVWERIWQHLPKSFHGGNFRAWLYQVARNYLVDMSRKKKTDSLQDDSALPDTRRSDPEEALLEQERVTILRRCLDKLGEEAAALVKGRLSGESYEEICQRIDLQPQRAHRLFHQAKEQLQDCVGRS